ncbi:multiheme c-type cytochrome [uncultured Salipiger sp.]|uniref:multiheme c-type cytochrome n=1 Tax=uncultured Salipiger sp. TaxID=499810 RepID=UPI0025976C9B|nr:multiheme c-type cytochrome [uncultured Salipiger sp.]
MRRSTRSRPQSVWRLLAAVFATALLATQAPAQEDVYVGSDTCAGCHTDAAEAWDGSHHALAWTEATPENILADFDGTEFALGNMRVRFRVGEDGSRVASVTERGGVTTEYPVRSVVGVAPLQQYLFETEPGRLQSFDVVWDTEKGEWFHLYPGTNPPPEDALHWSGPYKTWNARCATCHATGYEANYNMATRSYASEQAEIGVGCEACHGPGARHAEWAEQWPTTQAAPPENHGFPRDLSDPAAFLDTCGGCHSRREAYFDGTPPAGTSYHDAYNLSLLRPGLYWPDGQIRDEVYVLGSFLQSRMQDKGVTCSNCHDPHSSKLIAEGNAVCTTCHSPAGNPDFPSLPLEVFDSPEHHHHPEGSTGAQCKSCHMPEHVYMGNDWRADHSFRIPRPDLSAETGAPDACTSCHTDRKPDWAASEIANWFPDSPHRGPHYGQVLARAVNSPEPVTDDLAALATEEAQPGIVRATAIWLMAQEGTALDAATMERLLADPDPLVRASALDAGRSAEQPEILLLIAGMLDDPSRTVRIAAAKAMLGAPIAHLPGAMSAQLQQAQGEWQAALVSRLDFPETHLQLGGMALSTRRFPAAAQAFAEVTRLDPQHVDAWVMRARLAAALEDVDAVREILEAAIAANPEAPALQGMMSQIDAQSP